MYPDPRPSEVPSSSGRRRIRPAHVAAIAAVCVSAIGLMGLKYVALPDPAPVAPGEGLKIEVVAPVEPKPVPGSVMEVGELVDGFRYVAPRRPEPWRDVAWLEPEDLPLYEPPARPAVRRYEAVETVPPPPVEREVAGESDRRRFGFDVPLPDFGAERRARRARLDAIDRQRRMETQDRPVVRRYTSDAARPDAPRFDAPREPAVDEPTDGPFGPEVG